METHMLDKKNMGLRIRRAREQKHWTREQLAEKLELSVTAVADLERGKSGTRLETLVKLCALLGLSADYVLYGEPSPSAQAIAGMLADRDERTQHLVESTVRAMLDALDETEP